MIMTRIVVVVNRENIPEKNMDNTVLQSALFIKRKQLLYTNHMSTKYRSFFLPYFFFY